MGVCASKVFKQPICCLNCDTPYLFTLHVIAEGGRVPCPGCRTTIDLGTTPYGTIVTEVQKMVSALPE